MSTARNGNLHWPFPWRDIGGMTAGDIAIAAQVRHEQDKELAQTLAWIMYNCAALTGIAVKAKKAKT
jgi:hypothetical protein